MDDTRPGRAPERSPLLQNLLLFGRVLRAAGMRVTPRQLIELANSLSFIEIGKREDFKNTARCLLVNRHEDIPVFDAAFDAFWRAHGQRREGPLEELIENLTRQGPQRDSGSPRLTTDTRPSRNGASRFRQAPGEQAGPGQEDGDVEQTVLALYSPGEILRSKDFSRLTAGELADARRLLGEMRWAVIRRRSLRTRPARKGRRLDLRRSLRGSLRHGGEMVRLSRKGPKLKRRQLVLLCDISGSMERYTRLLLHFLHSVETSVQRTEVFVFGTRLTRVTPALRKRDPDAALAAVADQVEDWSGGTRIGEALRTFNRQWARRVLGQGAIVVIISDGWDRGNPDLLAMEMERLQRASYRLIWLNPLLGAESYQPLTQGILAALPFVDDFLPVHNLASLEALGRLLNDVQTGRPARRQARRPGRVA